MLSINRNTIVASTLIQLLFFLNIGCTSGFQNNPGNGTSDMSPPTTDSPDNSTPDTTNGSNSGSTESSTFYRVGSANTLPINEAGALNIYIDQTPFNPSAAPGTFIGVKKNATIDLGKIGSGSTTSEINLKIYNDRPEPIRLNKPLQTGDLAFNYDSAILFPIDLKAKSTTTIKFTVSAPNIGRQKSELTFDARDGSKINFIMTVK